MKFAKLITLALLFAVTTGYAQMHPGGGRMPFAGDEAFELIVGSVDAEVAAELTVARDSIDALRDELIALRDAEVVDQEAIEALRDELHTLRQSLRDQVRDVVDGNEELRAALGNLARETREEMLVSRYAFHNDDAFNEIVAAATTDQAAALVENQGLLDALRDELQVARDAGATREEMADLMVEARALRDEQRDLVSDVLDANDDLLAGVLEDARTAREATREQARERGFPGRRRGPGG